MVHKALKVSITYLSLGLLSPLNLVKTLFEMGVPGAIYIEHLRLLVFYRFFQFSQHTTKPI